MSVHETVAIKVLSNDLIAKNFAGLMFDMLMKGSIFIFSCPNSGAQSLYGVMSSDILNTEGRWKNNQVLSFMANGWVLFYRRCSVFGW